MSHPARFTPRPASTAVPPPGRPLLWLLAAAATALGACDSGGGGSSVLVRDAPGADGIARPSAATPAPGLAPGVAGGIPGADPTELYRDASGAGLPVAADQLGDAVVGAPGETVDCGGSLPCRWTSADAGFAVAALRVDNTGRDGRFEVHLRIDTAHDTALGVALAADAVDASGRRAAPTRVAMGDGRTAGTVQLAAGTPLAARVDFASPVVGTSLPAWSLLLDDNGTSRPAAFANLPIGPLAGDTVDCAQALPCTWQSADGLARIDLVGAGGFSSERRLHVAFRVIAAGELSLAAGPESHASGADGSAFRARSTRIGTAVAVDGVGVPVSVGVPTEGRIDFFRAPGAPASLETLVLDLYRDAPVPRWRPRFANVPALLP